MGKLNPFRRIEYSRTYQDTAYLPLLQDILKYGFKVMDRTGTGTIGINGYQAVYDMSRHSLYTDSGVLVVDNFPLFTTKRMFAKGIIIELLWFLRGETNIKYLVDNGVNIWNDWPLKYYNQQMLENNFDGVDRQMTEEQFIDAIKYKEGFAEQWGELGPVYGKQWRQWLSYALYHHESGAVDSKKAIDLSTQEDLGPYDVFIKRHDQLALMVHDLKNNPFSRRIIVESWNPGEVEEMAKAGLPPCHMEFQAFVRPNPENEDRPYIDLQMYQRSADCFLGVPFNVTSYSLLLCLLAKECGYLPGKFIHQMGSAHIYLNHIEQVYEQLSREPLRSPTLHITNPYDGMSILNCDPEDNKSYEYDDFVFKDYIAHKPIKGKVAV